MTDAAYNEFQTVYDRFEEDHRLSGALKTNQLIKSSFAKWKKKGAADGDDAEAASTGSTSADQVVTKQVVVKTVTTVVEHHVATVDHSAEAVSPSAPPST